MTMLLMTTSPMAQSQNLRGASLNGIGRPSFVPGLVLVPAAAPEFPPEPAGGSAPEPTPEPHRLSGRSSVVSSTDFLALTPGTIPSG